MGTFGRIAWGRAVGAGVDCADDAVVGTNQRQPSSAVTFQFNLKVVIHLSHSR